MEKSLKVLGEGRSVSMYWKKEGVSQGFWGEGRSISRVLCGGKEYLKSSGGGRDNLKVSGGREGVSQGF